MASQTVKLFDIYHSPHSICSLMARMTICMGALSNNDTTHVFAEHEINIGNEDQLTPGFLKVNPKGQIPAMESVHLETPLTDSVDITKYMCEVCPSLAPEPLKNTIYAALEQLHEIQYLSLSFTKQNESPYTKNINFYIERRMNQTGISAEYRQALEYKLNYHKQTFYQTDGKCALDPEAIANAEQQTRDFFALITTLYANAIASSSTTGTTTATDIPEYIFNGAHPTALDAHTIVFIARLYDVGRRAMVPEPWRQYGDRHLAGSAWTAVAKGKPTLPGGIAVWGQASETKGE